MSPQKSLSLLDRFELPHPSLSYSGRLMGLLCSIVSVPVIYMNRTGDHFSVSNAITTQLIRNDFPGLVLVTADQPLEEALRSSPITLCLEIHINDLPILVHCSPQIVLLAIDFDEYFVDVEGIAVASVLSLESSSIQSSELDTP
jgi:hypothetical protein